MINEYCSRCKKLIYTIDDNHQVEYLDDCEFQITINKNIKNKTSKNKILRIGKNFCEKCGNESIGEILDFLETKYTYKENE